MRLLHRKQATLIAIDVERPDVFQEFPDLPFNPGCGFKFGFKEGSPREKIRIEIQVAGSARWRVLKVIRLADLEVDFKPVYQLQFDQIFVNKKLHLQLLRGWIIPWGDFEITGLKAMVDDNELVIIEPLKRADVADRFGDNEKFLHSGFEIELPDLDAELFIRFYCEINHKHKVLCWQGHVNHVTRKYLDYPLGIHRGNDGSNYDMTHNIDVCFHDLANRYKKKLIGWIFDTDDAKRVNGIRIRYRNRIIEAKYPISRHDVAKIFHEVPHSTESGFEIEIPRLIGDPFLGFDYKSKNNKWIEFNIKTLDEIDSLDYLDQKVPSKKSGVKYRIDLAQVGRAYGYQYLLIGWCFREDDELVTEIRLKVDEDLFDAVMQKKRPDVKQAYSDTHKTAERSGYEIPVFNIKKEDTLRLEYKVEGSDWILFAEEEFKSLRLTHYLPFHNRRYNYELWRRNYGTLLNYTGNKAKNKINGLGETPLISILLPTYNTDPKFLEKAVSSLMNQRYENWELCIADDASTDESTLSALTKLSKRDSRIKIVFRKSNGHISLATNSGFELATGSWITFLDHDDELHPDALLRVVETINSDSGIRLIYTDEDKIKPGGAYADPFFKTDFDSYLLEGQNYLCHLMVVDRELYSETGGMRHGYEGSQDWDFALRATGKLQNDQIRHIPYVLYHWREIEGSTALSLDQKNYVRDSSKKALEDYMEKHGINGELVPAPHGHWNIFRRIEGKEPKVSILISSKNQSKLLSTCIESIQQFTFYRDYEIVIIDNQSDEPEALQYLENIRSDGVRVISYDKSFNFSAMNNLGARKAKGDVLVFLNNDITVHSPYWLHDMVALATKEDVGAVGAFLLYPEDCFQHAGIILGIGGKAGHAFRYFPSGSTGQRNRINLIHQVAAVTGACIAIDRRRFLKVGGFDQKHLKINHNDVDLCLKLREQGYVNLMAPRAVLYHHESASRGLVPEGKTYTYEMIFSVDKWKEYFERDKFYNPNLSKKFEDYSYNFPPAIGKYK